MTGRLLTASFVLMVALSAARIAHAGDLGISITQEGCGELDLDEVERIIGIEIQGMAEAEERSGELGLRIVCEPASVRITATEAQTGHKLERTTPPLAEAEAEPERVIALAASQLLLASWREIQDLREAREMLEELRELYEDGEISKQEFERRQEKISALYLGEGEVPDDACAKVTCSFHGRCVPEGGEPVCECDDEYEPAFSDPLSCVPSAGWPREAAITGLVLASLSALGGYTATAFRNPDEAEMWIGVGGANLALIGIMGPVVGGSTRDARSHYGVTGSPLLLGSAIAACSLSVIGGAVDYGVFGKGARWITATWSGLGALSLVLFSLDALITHEQLVEVRKGQPPVVAEDPGRIWTWISFGIGGAAAVGAVITGSLALQKSKSLEKEWALSDQPGSESLGDGVTERGRLSDPGEDDTKRENAVDELGIMALWTDLLIGAAVTGVVFGTVLYFVEPRLSAADPVQQVSVAPLVLPGGGGLALGGRF